MGTGKFKEKVTITRCFILFFIAVNQMCYAQLLDTSKYLISVSGAVETDQYFKCDKRWLGADGASAIDLGKNKLLWLFSDSFIANDTSRSRNKAVMIRNSIAVQEGYNLQESVPRFSWGHAINGPRDFFYRPGKDWYWTGHGTMVKDKLLVFLMNVKAVPGGFGFEVYGWTAVLISNPQEEPSRWKLKYIKGVETFGLIAGSAAVLKDEKFMYAYGAVEPETHEVYLLRWPINKAYKGDLDNPEWYIEGKWQLRNSKLPVPAPLFIGSTEFSVHYDKEIKKFVQVQSFGFGEASIGIRLADRLEGKWSDPCIIFTPQYTGIKQPFMYAAKAHPEINGKGIFITYNINSFDARELLSNQNLYYPRFIRMNIQSK